MLKFRYILIFSLFYLCSCMNDDRTYYLSIFDFLSGRSKYEGMKVSIMGYMHNTNAIAPNPEYAKLGGYENQVFFKLPDSSLDDWKINKKDCENSFVRIVGIVKIIRHYDITLDLKTNINMIGIDSVESVTTRKENELSKVCYSTVPMMTGYEMIDFE